MGIQLADVLATAVQAQRDLCICIWCQRFVLTYLAMSVSRLADAWEAVAGIRARAKNFDLAP